MTEAIRPRHRLATLAILLIPLAAGSCNGDQQSSRRRPGTVSAIAPSAAPASGLIGGHDNRTRMITGAGIAPIPGTEVGGYVDRFERDLRAKTAGTGIDLVRRGNELLLTLPSRTAFEGNGAAIAPTMRTTLDAVARLLAQYHQCYVDLSGFAEQALDDQTANGLSQSQAQALASYLQTRGVLAARIGAQGFGRSTAAAGRRVEIKLVPLTEADLPPPPSPARPPSGAR
jgi:outer membrane protein OmpA-like peptidoglycan-associated protein